MNLNKGDTFTIKYDVGTPVELTVVNVSYVSEIALENNFVKAFVDTRFKTVDLIIYQSVIEIKPKVSIFLRLYKIAKKMIEHGCKKFSSFIKI